MSCEWVLYPEESALLVWMSNSLVMFQCNKHTCAHTNTHVYTVTHKHVHTSIHLHIQMYTLSYTKTCAQKIHMCPYPHTHILEAYPYSEILKKVLRLLTTPFTAALGRKKEQMWPYFRQTCQSNVQVEALLVESSFFKLRKLLWVRG